jgi:hypothetical protein
MNIQMPFVMSAEMQRQIAAEKATKAATAKLVALKSAAASLTDVELSELSLQELAMASTWRDGGTDSDALEASRAVKEARIEYDEEDDQATRARKHARLRILLAELRAAKGIRRRSDGDEDTDAERARAHAVLAALGSS